MNSQVRRARAEDATAISQVVIAALRHSNAQDYPPAVIDQVVQHFSPAAILHFLTQRQVYVATLQQRVAATASLDQDVVRSVFVDPDHQGRGIGQQLMGVIHTAAADAGIEQLRVPSSLTAEGFYRRLGYEKVRDQQQGAERTLIMGKRLL
ncbi:GNAT family N-acetyltransferase [Pseudomonas sp. RA_35y_Pfl2_P32]|uniref:GNAT family N-acetyltransferase n=1 Tax=Pseudomonas sp. RA_35y_Pfl2_P32 TaxID=3088705 RepID=UPI0030DABB95